MTAALQGPVWPDPSPADRCTGARCGHYRAAHNEIGACRVLICGCEFFRAEADR